MTRYKIGGLNSNKALDRQRKNDIGFAVFFAVLY